MLSRRARSVYWLVLLRLYAHRLKPSATQLHHWPHARPAYWTGSQVATSSTSRRSAARIAPRSAGRSTDKAAGRTMDKAAVRGSLGRRRHAAGVDAVSEDSATARGSSGEVGGEDDVCASSLATRREDEHEAARLAKILGARLARARRTHPVPQIGVRPAAQRAVPEGGDASLELLFQSDAEQRSMVPELDHAYLQAARQTMVAAAPAAGKALPTGAGGIG